MIYYERCSRHRGQLCMPPLKVLEKAAIKDALPLKSAGRDATAKLKSFW